MCIRSISLFGGRRLRVLVRVAINTEPTTQRRYDDKSDTVIYRPELHATLKSNYQRLAEQEGTPGRIANALV